jgi:hypothetical protein
MIWDLVLDNILSIHWAAGLYEGLLILLRERQKIIVLTANNSPYCKCNAAPTILLCFGFCEISRLRFPDTSVLFADFKLLYTIFLLTNKGLIKCSNQKNNGPDRKDELIFLIRRPGLSVFYEGDQIFWPSAAKS